MATPIGHALAGLAVGRLGDPREGHAAWSFAALCAAVAVAPDLDFLPGVLLGTPPLYHQGVTHSLVAAAVVSALATLAFRPRPRGWMATWALLLAAYASHLAIDLLGPDARAPYGIPLFWPLADTSHLAPFTIFPGVSHAQSTMTGTSEWVSAVASRRNLGAIAVELMWIGPWVVLGEALRRRRGAEARLRNGATR